MIFKKIIEAVEAWNPAMWTGFTGMSFVFAVADHWSSIFGLTALTWICVLSVVVTFRG